MIGVTFNKGTRKWRAGLNGYGRNGYIGEFDTEAQAATARKRAELQLHGRAHSEPEVEFRDGMAFIPLMGARGRHVATATVDEIDLELLAGRWNLSKSGYAVQRRDGRIVYMHRVIVPDGEAGDHVDGDRLNNRRSNLRACTRLENSRNKRNLNKNNSSGIKGVSRACGPGKPWRARIWCNRREIFLGRFDTKAEALAAYKKASSDLHGAFGSVAANERDRVAL